ncbi:MAG: mannose-6-phosphate isomerase [candidate division Zixibacteria bacterium HGW-Zixibacteria-1]|nr:MAG: mannose-6-phosphate isomerase [candidate division Zixibacteria bacterium HGW-Zixibacteria-1]
MGLMTDEVLKRIITDIRPWGNFIQYTNNEICTVKIITVDPNQTLSLQSHKKRDELWVVLDEGLRVELDDETLTPKPGDQIFIPRHTKHRLGSIGKRARVMEISFGYFDENDIERYDDIYGRIKKNKDISDTEK